MKSIDLYRFVESTKLKTLQRQDRYLHLPTERKKAFPASSLLTKSNYNIKMLRSANVQHFGRQGTCFECTQPRQSLYRRLTHKLASLEPDLVCQAKQWYQPAPNSYQGQRLKHLSQERQMNNGECT